MVSRKTVARMSRYRRLLAALRQEGVDSIYSHQLARHAVVSAAQVRRDLMVIGYSGSPNRGYDVDACLASVCTFLDPATRQDVCIVGVGNLGRAVLSHFSGTSPALAIVAGFDLDPALRGTKVHGCRVFDVAHLEPLVTDLGIEIAVVTVPEDAAQGVADALVRAGVKSIISFAPVPLRVPDEIFVEYMDFTAALESAAFFARSGMDGAAGDRQDTAPIVRQLDSVLARSHMKLEDLALNIGARVVTPGKAGGTQVARIYAGDRVSDLLNEATDRTLLVSNLASVQMLRVAELMDVPGICFVNGVEPTPDVVELAAASGTMLLVSPAGVFETCGLIYQSLGGDGHD